MKRYRVKAMMQVEFTVPAESFEAAKAGVAKMGGITSAVVNDIDDEETEDGKGNDDGGEGAPDDGGAL